MKARLKSGLIKNRLTDRSGFTLIEVLIAITIFAIGLLALAGMQVTGIRTNATASEITARAALAEGVMEEIMSDGSGINFATAQTNVNWTFDDGETTFLIAGAGSFTAVYSITPDNPVSGVSRVDVRLTNASGQRVGSDIVITSFKRRN